MIHPLDSKRRVLVAMLLTAGPFAAAQDSGWYLGAGIGRSRLDVDARKLGAALPPYGYLGTSFELNRNDTAYKVSAGYGFNRYFALEAAYVNLGSFSYEGSTLAPGSLRGRMRVDGPTFGAVLTLPFSDAFSFFVRGGAVQARSRDDLSGTSLLPGVDARPTDNGTGLTYGAGLQWGLGRRAALRLEAERYRVNDPVLNRRNLDVAYLGLLVRLGRVGPAPYVSTYVPPPAPAPEPVPAPEPMMVVVPVQANTQEYCTILDLQFEIDGDQIQRADKEKLAVLGTFMSRYPATTALIEGHTDNTGTLEHNTELSLKRAEAVVAYLVGPLGIEASRLKATGYGPNRPIADNATDEGKRRNRRINAVIACVTDVEGLDVKPARMTMALDLAFDANRAEVKPEYDASLRKVALFLKANPETTATVEGHTGNLQGTADQAMEISRKRAQNVVRYLVDTLGVDRNRLSAQGFGRTRLVAYNTSAEGAQENRRVNIIINYPNGRP